MSEIERLLGDLQSKSELRGRILGSGADVDAVVRAANENGYAVTRTDADAWLAAQQAGELDDATLNAVAGGGKGLDMRANIDMDAAMKKGRKVS